jgi:hypothetical protein
MPSNHQFPTLWDPQQLFFHLAVWAGVPAIVMAVAAALLGIYKSVKDWIRFGKSIVGVGPVARKKFQSWTTSQQRAMTRLIVFSVLMVAFSYMVAVIIDTAAKENSNLAFSVQDVVNRVGVTPWPPAAVWTIVIEVVGIGLLGIACIADLRGLRKFVTTLGGVVWIATWLLGLALGLATVMMCLGLLLNAAPPHNSVPGGVPPVPLVVTVAVTGLLSLVLAQLLPRVRVASADAFDPSTTGSVGPRNKGRTA